MAKQNQVKIFYYTVEDLVYKPNLWSSFNKVELNVILSAAIDLEEYEICSAIKIIMNDMD